MTTKIEPTDGFNNSYGNYGCKPMYTEDQLAAAVAAERERCAQLCEKFLDVHHGFVFAEAIRSLKP